MKTTCATQTEHKLPAAIGYAVTTFRLICALVALLGSATLVAASTLAEVSAAPHSVTAASVVPMPVLAD
jgi:hypothetical protein